MLSALKEKISQHLLADAMRGVMGNQNAIRQKQMSRINQLLAAMWPDLQAAVQAEVSVVRDHLLSAEREVVLAADEAKTATGITFRATQTLLASLDAVHDAEARIVDSQNAVIRAEANLAQAKIEFAKLVERAR
jgi:prophage DNA circulation protein